MTNETGKKLGLLGLVLAILAYFIDPFMMGMVSFVLGLMGMYSDQKILNGIVLVISVAMMIYGGFPV